MENITFDDWKNDLLEHIKKEIFEIIWHFWDLSNKTKFCIKKYLHKINMDYVAQALACESIDIQ